MSTPIEDYAIIGDTRTVAAVARNGSVDWWCVPRIDSGAVFAALLGEPEHGRWCVAPKGEVTAIRRRYAGDSLVLETEFEHRRRYREGDRLHVTRASTVRRSSASSRACRARSTMAPRADRPVRLRLDRAVGAVDRRRPHAGRGQRRAAFPQPGAAAGEDLTTTADFTVARGSTTRLLARVVLGARRPAAAARRVGALARDRAVLGGVDRALHLRRASGATTSCAR